MICPVCKASHKGPRDVELLHHELSRILTRAAEMTIVEASRFLRAGTLFVGFELSGFCTNCTLNAQAQVAGSIASSAIDAVRDAESALQAVNGEQTATERVCQVIPLFPRRNLLDLGAKFDSERK